MRDVKNMRNTVNMQKTQTKKQGKYKSIIIGILFFVIGIGIWVWFSNRGEWVCENGEWIIQGKTNESRPTELCQNDVILKSGDVQKPSADMIKLDSEKVAEGIDIRVKTPHVNATISSPIMITGEAMGWYKDDAFIVHLIGKDGTIFGKGVAKAQLDVDEDEYVSFETEIKFEQGDAKSGDLIFYRNSTEEDLGDAGTFSFPVFFE